MREDLIERLRALARCEHSDVSVAEEAADALGAALEDARVLRRGNERLAEALRELEGREQRDEALLRQALEALELRCGTHADERKKLIPALRERLGEGGAMIYAKETSNE